MKIIFHPRVRQDLREILDYYDVQSDTAGDRFFAEFEAASNKIESNPQRFHFVDELRRRCNLHQFPHHLIFEIHGDQILVTVLRHHKRHPSFGLSRRWP